MFFGLDIVGLSIEDTREAISLTGSEGAAAGHAPGSSMVSGSPSSTDLLIGLHD